MSQYDVIIRGGLIVDGTKTPAYVSDLAIKDGRIAKIGGLRGVTASKVLDASGLIVAPGFIDLHTHYDAQILWDPYCTLSGWHGVTSVVIGNCGFGFAPCKVEDRDRYMRALTRNEAIPYEAMRLGMQWEKWDWVSFPEFLNTLDRTPKGVNVMSYVPLSPIYAWAMGGYEEAKRRRPTEGELKEMCNLVHEAMDAGGMGWTAQVSGPEGVQMDYDATPMITDLMTDEEILAFARVLGERDEGSMQLTLSNEREDLKEMFEKVAEVSGRPLIYQSVVPDATQQGKLSWLEECARRGLRVFGQAILYFDDQEFTFQDWNLFDSTPGWREATLGTPAQRKAKMQDPELRAKMRAEWDAGNRPTIIEGSIPAIIVTEVADPKFEHYVGQTVGEIAADEEKHVIDALLDLVVADDLRTEFLGHTGAHDAQPQHMAEILKHPLTVTGNSDGGAHVKFLTLPDYPTRLLSSLVRDTGVVSLEEAHFKLGYLTAYIAGIRDRGFLREDAPADIVVYDLEKLSLPPQEIVHDLPGGDWRRVQKAEGYRWIVVNGQVTFEDGKETGELPGKVLRHGRG